MEISIRKAVPEDAEEISAIWAIVCSERKYTAVNEPFTPQQEQEYIASLSNREGIFLAEIDEKIVGFQSLDQWAKFTDSFDHVGTMGTIILPDWRRNGIGLQLANHSFQFACNNGFEKILIYVRAENVGAIAFYKNLGFIQKGVLSHQVKIDDKYEDEIFMELFL